MELLVKTTNKNLFRSALPAALVLLAATQLDAAFLTQAGIANLFPQISNCFSAFYTQFANWMPGMKNLGAKNYSTSLSLLTAPKTAPVEEKPSFQLEPKKLVEGYQKGTNTVEKELTKEFFMTGKLAPHNVVPEIKKLISTGSGEAVFAEEAMSLRVSVFKAEEPGRLGIALTLIENNNSTMIGERWFYTEFKQIKTKEGKKSEQFVMHPGAFRIVKAYRQKGVGGCLFSLQNSLLASYLNATGIIHPYPYDLVDGDTQEKLLSTLRAYYESLGFIPHPTKPEHMIISFKNGKPHPVMDLFKALYKRDVAAIEKFLDNGLSLDTIIHHDTAAETALYHIFSQNDKQSLKIINIFARYGIFKDPENFSFALECAVRLDKPELLSYIIPHGALKTPEDVSNALKLAIKYAKGWGTPSFIFLFMDKCSTLNDPKDISLVLDYILRWGKTELLDIFITKYDIFKEPKNVSLAQQLAASCPPHIQKLLAAAIKKNQIAKPTDIIKE